MNRQNDMCINLFQNNFGEICAEVIGDGHRRKLVKNIERFAKTSDILFGYILEGFRGFPDFDPQKYDGRDIESVLVELTEDCGYNLIIHLEFYEFGGIGADYYFENMTEATTMLTASIKNYTDNEEEHNK